MKDSAAHPAAEFVRACALAEPTPRAARALETLLEPIGDWHALEAAIASNRLRPEAAAHFSHLRLEGEAARVRESIQLTARAFEGQAKLNAGELLTVLRALRADGIDALPFKGPAFAGLTRGSMVRECDDLDVIVARRDLAEAVRCLERAGYVSKWRLSPHALRALPDVAHELPLFGVARVVMLELHWRLAPPWHPPTLAEPRFFERLRDHELLGETVRWPCAEHLLLMHVADGLKGRSPGARWLGDLAAILRRERELDWSLVRERASEGAGSNGLRVAMAALQRAATSSPPMRAATEVDSWLPESARELARQAMRSPRLAKATSEVLDAAGVACARSSAVRELAWGVRLSDRRLASLGHVARYLSRPTVADLVASAGAEPPSRLRAFGRRLRGIGRAAGLRT